MSWRYREARPAHRARRRRGSGGRAALSNAARLRGGKAEAQRAARALASGGRAARSEFAAATGRGRRLWRSDGRHCRFARRMLSRSSEPRGQLLPRGQEPRGRADGALHAGCCGGARQAGRRHARPATATNGAVRRRLGGVGGALHLSHGRRRSRGGCAAVARGRRHALHPAACGRGGRRRLGWDARRLSGARRLRGRWPGALEHGEQLARRAARRAVHLGSEPGVVRRCQMLRWRAQGRAAPSAADAAWSSDARLSAGSGSVARASCACLRRATDGVALHRRRGQLVRAALHRWRTVASCKRRTFCEARRGHRLAPRALRQSIGRRHGRSGGRWSSSRPGLADLDEMTLELELRALFDGCLGVLGLDRAAVVRLENDALAKVALHGLGEDRAVAPLLALLRGVLGV